MLKFWSKTQRVVALRSAETEPVRLSEYYGARVWIG